MCEPAHSVTQWVGEQAFQKVVDDLEINVIDSEPLTMASNLPTWSQKEVTDNVGQWEVQAVSILRMRMLLGEEIKALSEIDGFYHLSRFGKGHSESRYSRLGRLADIPKYTAYEIMWWDREVKLDGALYVPRLDVDGKKIERLAGFIRKVHGDHAYEACKKYAERTSIGDTGVLRRFLEQTLGTTERLVAYETPLDQLLSSLGRDEFRKRLRLADISKLSEADSNTEKKIRLIKIVCGLTRNPSFLNESWK